MFFLLFGICFAQKSPIKFGDISMEELNMKVYLQDSSASAVILAEYGKAYVSLTNVSAKLYFEKHVRIKVLKSDGTKYSDQEIMVYRQGVDAEERVTNLKASSYSLVNGKVEETKMDKDKVYKEKFNRNNNLLKFSIPNVKVGSVIEYTYTLQSDFLSNFPNWQFQHDIPTILSEYWAVIPEFFIMEKYSQGYISPSSYENKQRTQSSYYETAHHWVYKNVPAFKAEPFMTSVSDYITKINFALAYINFPGEPRREIMGTWEKLVDNLKESEAFGKAIKGSGFLKKNVEALTAGKNSDLEKIAAIHNYVKQTIEWDGQQDFLADNLKDVLEKKQGTVGDINILMASMLEKAGFVPEMILLSTRDHGFIRKSYPMSKQLNYVICRVNVGEGYVYLDATEKFLPINVLPERCLNGEGLLVSNTSFGWIPINTKTKSKRVFSADIDLQEVDKPVATITKLNEGYFGQASRRTYKRMGRDEYKKLVSNRLNLAVEELTIEDYEAIDKPMKEIYKVNLAETLTLNDDIIYIDPLLNQQYKENPFKADKREYPIDYGSAQDELFMVKITLPEGYQVDELPQSKVFILPDKSGRFTYNAQLNGNVINIMSSLQINKPLYIGEEYQNLREFYSQVIAKQQEQIVLRKK